MKPLLFAAGMATILSQPAAADVFHADGQARQGAYIGDLKLCADTVADYTISRDEFTGEIVVNIVLLPKAAQIFAELTTRKIGKAVPVIIDGVEVIAPIINEPIVDGAIQITGADEAQRSAIGQAANGPC